MRECVVLQDGIKECGCACLLSVIRYYKGNMSLERLVELTNTGKDGTNFYDISRACLEIGLSAKGYKIDEIFKLKEIKKPFISQVVINNVKHFVVVYKIKNNKITIMDPAKGMVNMNLVDFNLIWTGYILLMEPYKKLPVYKEDNYILKLLKEVISTNKRSVYKLIILTLGVILFTCLYSYYFQIAIDTISYNNKNLLVYVTVIFMIMLFIKLLMEYLRNNVLFYLNKKIDLSVISTTINKIIFLPYNYYKNKTTGEVISRVNDLIYIKNIISKLLMTIFLDSLLAVIVLIILFYINIKMTLLLLGIIIIYILIFLIFRPIIKNMTNINQEDNAKINSLLVETISGYETVKGLNLENIFNNKINKLYLKTINNNFNFMKILNEQESIKNFQENVIILIIICLGINYVMDKSMTLGALITFNTLLYYVILPVREFVDIYREIYYVKNSIRRINNLVNFKSEIFDVLSGFKINGDIKINKLCFGYNGVKNIINNFSLNINNQEKILFLGKTGIGKTTILKILYKYYDVDSGMVSINGRDINDFTLRDIRENITYISQNEILYTDTIRNNILLNRDVSLEEFSKVCKIACVDDIISDKMLSYDYMIEENGANLSGGQKQRIILARSLLKKSKILLIDEGFNEIDINLERKILKNIFEFYNDKTIIVISHRKNNIDLYDRVININKNVLLGN